MVRPVARDPDATWRPRRWIADLPALLDEADLEGWLAWAKPRVELAYHAGPSLADARERDPMLDRLAWALLLRAEAEWAIVTPPPCGHVRGLVVGSRELELLQRRLGPANWLYLARRR